MNIWICMTSITSFPRGLDGKEAACNAAHPGSSPWLRKIPWRRAWLSSPVFLPGESHGQRSQVGYSQWGCTESDTTNTHTTSELGVLTIPCLHPCFIVVTFLYLQLWRVFFVSVRVILCIWLLSLCANTRRWAQRLPISPSCPYAQLFH